MIDPDAIPCDGVGIDGVLSGGLPVYSFVNNLVTHVAEEHLGMSRSDAKVMGMSAGSCASLFTAIFSGTP
jgi:hypothetical protein